MTANASSIWNLVYLLTDIGPNRSLIPVPTDLHASPNTKVIPSLFKNLKLHHFHQQHIAQKQITQQSLLPHIHQHD